MPTNDTRQFLDPTILASVASIELKARLVVEGFVAGLHRSPFHGFSVEFAEHRQYMPGDPIKHIDWKVYGKSDRFYIKEYEEETNIRAYLLVDASASMAYGTAGVSKLQYATYVAASLAYLMNQQQDAVGLLTFDSETRTYIPPRATTVHLREIFKRLEALEAGERATTAIGPPLHELAEKVSRRGLVVILSDLFDDPQTILSGLKHFRHRGHEVLVVHVLDGQEIDFAFDRETQFEDLETGEKVTLQPWQIREEYRRNIADMQTFFRTECHNQRIDYVPIDTRTSFDQTLREYLHKRAQLY